MGPHAHWANTTPSTSPLPIWRLLFIKKKNERRENTQRERGKGNIKRRTKRKKLDKEEELLISPWPHFNDWIFSSSSSVLPVDWIRERAKFECLFIYLFLMLSPLLRTETDREKMKGNRVVTGRVVSWKRTGSAQFSERVGVRHPSVSPLCLSAV